MRKAAWLSGAIMAGALAGCTSPGQDSGPLQSRGKTPPTTNASDASGSGSVIVATAGGANVTRDELITPLLQAYGMKVLLPVMQRNMAREQCRQLGLAVTPEDIAHERVWSIEYLTSDMPPKTELAERERTLQNVLSRPRAGEETMTMAEFNVLVESNAYMRKIVDRSLANSITDEQLQQQFDRQYGAKRLLRHIMVANPQDAIKVRARLDAKEDFAAVAKELSIQRDTGERGGLLQPFTANDTRVQDSLRNVAFSMTTVGEVSDPVQVDGGYHILKLVEKIPPKAVKFEDVKESLRENVKSRLVIEGVKELRERLAVAAVKTLQVKEPVLAREVAARQEAITRNAEERMKADLERQRGSTTAPTTLPSWLIRKPPRGPATTQSTGPNTAPADDDLPGTAPAATPPAAPGAAAPGGATNPPAPDVAPATKP